MPGLTDRDQYFMGILRDKKASAEQKAAAMYQWQQESEGFNRRRGVEGSGFSGSATGEVTGAPWRGEFDMPGNFERKQKIANAMAEDAMSAAGRSYQYGWKPGQMVEASWMKTSPAMAANAPSYARDQTEKIFYTGPPDSAAQREHMFDPMRWDPSGKRPMTEDQVKRLADMISRGKAEWAERTYGGMAGYDQILEQLYGG